MMRPGLIFSIVLFATSVTAQKQSDHFLADVFAINSFKLNATLVDIQNNKELAENLSFDRKMDDNATYRLIGQQINLPGLKSLERLAFDTIYLTFENNKLHEVDVYVPKSFEDVIFTKTCNQFNEKYGHFVLVDQENNKYKKYVWNLGTKEISLRPDPDGVLIHYASKISDKKIGWLYSDRKGKGNGTIQLNLSYFEKLLDDHLTIAAFEKLLPQWVSKGDMNHVAYEYDFKRLNEKSPVFFITYSLKNCEMIIHTVDTTSKIVSEFMLEKITDAGVLDNFERDLNNGHYKKRQMRDDRRSVSYSNDKYLVFLDKSDSRVTILKELNFLSLLKSFSK